MAITQTNAAQKKGKFFLGCFFSFFMLFGLGMSMIFLWPIVNVVQAKNWRPTPCTILESRVESHRGSKGGTTYSVEVRYEYFVDEQRYVGTRYKFMSGSSSGYDGKKEIVDRLAPGTKATCYVNRRDPADSVIERGLTGDVFFGCIPLVFALIGAGGIFGVFIYRKKHPKPGASPGMPVAAPPVKGAVPLKTSTSPAVRFGCMLFFALFWNGIVSVFVVQCWSGWRGGNGDGCMTAFLVPFVLVGLAVLVGVVYSFLALFNPRPVLKMSASAVALGDSVEVEWETTGNVDRVKAFTISLEGREEATYKRGTSTSTDKSTFMKIVLVDSSVGRELKRGRASFTIPPDSMHSFKSRNNKFVWFLQLKGDIPNWPDIGEEYAIEVLPHRTPPGGPA